MSGLNADALSELERLEESLWLAATRFDIAYMDRILAPDFFEFGRSGRIYRRDDTLAVAPIASEPRLPLPNFAAVLIAPGVALVTYRSEVRFDDGVKHANRSSLWLHDGTAWRLRLHQGTALPVQD